MTQIPSYASFARFSIFFCSTFLRFTPGYADGPSDTKELKNAANHHSPKSSKGLKVFIICLGVVVVVAFSVFLFKLWEKKKKEEQHARLLRLFEDDDELEVELGMRD